MLEIKQLHISVDNQPIVKGLNLSIKPGEVHVIMGPNGSGKSTLSHALSGHSAYTVSEGEAQFLGQDLLQLSPEDRAGLGVFLGFQYPIEIPGVNNLYFLKMALNSVRKYRKQPPLDAMDIMALVKDKCAQIGMPESFLKRSLNEGFSGGEKKRNEILQMLLLEPKLVILDEVDSGLDVDALQAVAEGVNLARSPERSFLIVTHYQRLLNYVKPDVVHIMAKGQILASGGPELAMAVEEKGYQWLMQ